MRVLLVIFAFATASCCPIAVRLVRVDHAMAENEVEWMTPCARNSAEWARAARAIDAFERAIEALEPGDDTEAVREMFSAMMFDEQCLAIADEARPPMFRSAISTRAWWERGGEEWLRNLWNAGSVVFPPHEREVLTLESAPADDPLRPLLCLAADASCGRATLGWRRRAELAFSAHEMIERSYDPDAERRACEREARAVPEAERYARWWSCVDGRRTSWAALPHGHFRAPSEGWLVVRGNRRFLDCPEIATYDLATGAAYIVRTCGPDERELSAPYRPRPQLDAPTVVTGRLPLEALREAAWMLLLEPTLGWDYPSETVALPAGIRRRVPRATGLQLYGTGRGAGGSSHSSRLEWAWLLAGAVQAEGDITTPGDDLGDRHAYQLLMIAEAAFAEGCAPAPLPSGLARGAERDVLLEQLVREGSVRPTCP